ncbi:MAG TPA: hypothetical protein VGG29_20160 [Caulobacteraceae bacterium]
MIGRPGSTLWLFGHELRLTWRGLLGARRARMRIVALSVVGAVLFLGALPVGWLLRRVQVPVLPISILAADAVCLGVFTLMLSQTLATAIDALYSRGDLDLLFSSPLDPRKTLTVRFASLAASAFMSFALLVTPFLLPVAVMGHWAWLGALVVLAALALTASALGLALAVALFALIGPRRTRAVAQILAAIIGAAFFLASQARTLLGAKGSSSMAIQLAAVAADPRLRLPPLADWPLRAMLGEPLPLAALLAVGVVVFMAVTAWLSRRFVRDAAAAQGADTGQHRAPGRTIGAFAGGVFATTYLKEFRILRRDIALLAQVLLRVLYLLPVTFLVLRNAGQHMTWALAGGAAAIAFLSGQVASSLTWITVSAEEVPELIASAPAASTLVRNAKLAAGLTPLAVMLIPLLALLIEYAPLAGLAAAGGSAFAALAAGMINAWYPTHGKRSEFRRRRSGNLVAGIVLVVVTLLIGAATALAALPSVFATGPALLAIGVLLVMRRTPTQVADALAEAGT